MVMAGGDELGERHYAADGMAKEGENLEKSLINKLKIQLNKNNSSSFDYLFLINLFDSPP